MSESTTTIFDRQRIFNEARGPDGLDVSRVVKELTAGLAAQPKKRQIPEGKDLPSLMTDEETASNIVYTWLRNSSNFKSMTISFAEDPEKYRLNKVTIVNYSQNSPIPGWKRDKDQGISVLKDSIARQLMRNKNVVKITLEPSGVAIWTDKDEKFGPVRKATAKDVSAYNAAVKEAQSENPDATFPSLEIGTIIDNEDFAPYIEWVPLKEKLR